MADDKCFLCRSSEMSMWPVNFNGYGVDCPRCGRYEITHPAATNLQHISDYERAVVRHTVRKATGVIRVTTAFVASLEGTRLPSVSEQADNFILYLGRQFEGAPGPARYFNYDLPVAAIGAFYDGDVRYIVDQLADLKLITYSKSGSNLSAQLTFTGWKRFEELVHAQVDSRRAFMAMPFKNAQIESIYRDWFKPAVAECGFVLSKLDDEPKAGPIDNQLRVELRRSRFLIAEMSDSNRGAYWEAGFMEGLGRPVFYTCEKSRFDQVHFDANHCHHVIWENDKLADAVRILKATIRATLPEEASLSDMLNEK